MIVGFRGENVLVTGGTMGIGLAIALAFGQHGARCWLTYKWGTADEEDVYRQFAEAGAPRPQIVRADVSSAEDTEALLQELHGQVNDIRVLVSNVTEGMPVHSFEEYSARALEQAIGSSAW